MSSGLLQVFVELWNLHGNSNYILYWIHGVTCSDSIYHKSWLQASNNTGIINTYIRLWLSESEQVTPADSIKFRVGPRVRQTPEEGLKIYRPKRWRNNNKEEDSSPKTLNDKKKISGLCIYHLVKINSLEQFPVDHLSQLFDNIGLAVRVFANGPGDLRSISGRVIPKTLKMVLDVSLLNTQHYKVRIKGKVEQSRERSSALPYTLV